MSNRIVEQYFEPSNFPQRAEEITRNIIDDTSFIPERELFKGKLYAEEYVRSIIIKGQFQGKSAVLKIQGLKPETEEPAIIASFEKENASKSIRLPKILLNKSWDDKLGYGYFIMEYVNGKRIYDHPLASDEQRNEFVKFYEEYRTKALIKPFIAQMPSEESSSVFTARRVSHWARIAESQDALTSPMVQLLDRYITVVGHGYHGVPMEFMHGHLTADDIRKLPDETWIIMSNLFWSWRPKYYDAAFHLWAGIKAIDDLTVTSDQVIAYLDGWQRAYQQLPPIAEDENFDNCFAMNMLERCIGALLLDIRYQNYPNDPKTHIAHLTNIFSTLFEYYERKIVS